MTELSAEALACMETITKGYTAISTEEDILHLHFTVETHVQTDSFYGPYNELRIKGFILIGEPRFDNTGTIYEIKLTGEGVRLAKLLLI